MLEILNTPTKTLSLHSQLYVSLYLSLKILYQCTDLNFTTLMLHRTWL